MNKHEVRIKSHVSNPSLARDEAIITIKPPLPNLTQAILAAEGVDAEAIWTRTAPDTRQSRLRIGTYGIAAQRTAAIVLFADRLSLLANDPSSLETFSHDEPFSSAGWDALHEHVNSVGYALAHPYHGRTDLPDYTPSRLVQSEAES